MSVITEAALRAMFKEGVPKQLTIKKSDIITPSARQLLKERKIEVVEEELVRPITENKYMPFEVISSTFEPKYVSFYDGGYFDVKPEHMTHLYGNVLVQKNDPRIVFRGRVDSFESHIMEVQIRLLERNEDKIVSALDEILMLVRNILRAEVKGEKIAIDRIIGLSDSELREHSHQPKKYYGIAHFVPDIGMGVEVVLLNKLRTYARELELAAMDAFVRNGAVERQDILQILNRLSSTFYIMMCKVRSGSYKKESM